MSPLTQEEFDRFLHALDPNPAEAGVRYEELRRRLIRFFSWEGCARPEEWTDVSLNRAAHRIGAGEDVRNVGAYVSGVARLVAKEARRAERREESGVETMPLAAPPPEDDSERQQAVEQLGQCLSALSADSRRLIIDYYSDAGGGRIRARQRMAEHLGISLNSLRNRALRVRERIERCLAGKLERDGIAEKDTKR